MILVEGSGNPFASYHHHILSRRYGVAWARRFSPYCLRVISRPVSLNHPPATSLPRWRNKDQAAPGALSIHPPPIHREASDVFVAHRRPTARGGTVMERVGGVPATGGPTPWLRFELKCGSGRVPRGQATTALCGLPRHPARINSGRMWPLILPGRWNLLWDFFVPLLLILRPPQHGF